MFYMLKNCIIILTVLTLVCSILLTSSALYLIFYKTKKTNNNQNNCFNRQIYNNDINSAISSEIISIQDSNTKHSAPPSFFGSIKLSKNGEYNVNNYAINNQNNLKYKNNIIENCVEPENSSIKNYNNNLKNNSKKK